MSKYQVKELKKLRPSLTKYPSTTQRTKKRQALHAQNWSEYSGVILLVAVIFSLVVLPHLAFANVPSDTAAATAAVQPAASGYTLVHAQAGASAWSLIQSANSSGVNMDEALSRFRALNGTVNIREGFTYKVPVIP